MSGVSQSLQRKSPSKKTGGKQIRLRLQNIDFWSAMKLAAVVGFVIAIIQIVVTILMWLLLEILGVFSKVDELLQDLLASSQFTLMDFISLPSVILFSVIVGILNFVVITILGALAALIYNRSVPFTGGLLVGFTNQ